MDLAPGVERNPGAHTSAAVAAALVGATGSRRWTFRYEVLDADGVVVVADLTTVSSCTVSYDSLADVKRKAKIVLRDTGEIDFLSDRIRPYARLHLPPYGVSDWVEWPMGVFLLSTPRRSADDSGLVVRDVDGYDLTQSYVDDLVEDRYTVSATRTVLEDFEDDSYVLDLWGEWGRSSDAAASGSYSLRAPVTGDYGRSRMYVAVPSGAATMSLSYKVSSETSYDYFRVYLDGVSIFEDSGAVDWTSTSVSVSGGNLVTLAYEKDGSIDEGDDTAWVDQVSFPGVATLYTDAISELIDHPDAVIVPCSAAIGSDLDWDPGTKKLTIINELLAAIGYRSLWIDPDGAPHATPYVDPADRSPEYVYADDSISVVYPTVVSELDLYSVPNRWVRTVSRPDAAMLTSSHTNTNPSSPTSTVSRGRTIVSYATVTDIADQATLDALVLRVAREATSVYETVTLDTAIMPIHGDSDVYTITYSPLAINAKYSETSWSMPLEAGAAMRHSARRSVTV